MVEQGADTITLALTEKEIHIFTTLWRANGEPVSRQTLSERFFLSQGDRSVDVHVCNIRGKLRRAGITGIELLGVRGIGYCLR